MQFTEQNIEETVKQLSRSERGRGALKHVLDLLKGDGLGLDSDNLQAVITLIVPAWASHPETARDAARRALGIG